MMKKSLILIAILLVFMSSAYAKSDWRDLQVLVSWIDNGGNTHSATAVPLEWSKNNAFWVQVPDDAPLDGLTLFISHPNHPDYAFAPGSGEVLTNVQNAKGLESNPFYITAFSGYMLSDTFVLYLSTNISPTQPPVTPTPVPTLTPAPTEKPPLLSSREVQFNMPNRLDREFSLTGYAYLDDYYNYGFSNYEKTHFCMMVEPEGSKYGNHWYIYCSRFTFSKLFNDLLENDVILLDSVCLIPKYVYESGQGNMAVLQSANWMK